MERFPCAKAPRATGDREATARRKRSNQRIPKPTASSIPDAPTEEREFSFDDIDWIDEKQTYFRYEAEVNLGAQAARGNTDTADLHFDALFEPTFGWNTIRLLGEFDKKEADGDTDDGPLARLPGVRTGPRPPLVYRCLQ